MRKLLSFVIGSMLCMLFLFTCKKEKFDLPTEIPNEVTVVIPPETKTQFDGVNQFAISNNYIMRFMNLALTSALLSPQMHGLQAPLQADTRTCPMVTIFTDTLSDPNNPPNVMLLDFGTGCNFSNTTGGTDDFISGVLRLEAFGPITTNGTNIFLIFDELKINDMRIKFVAGNPVADWIKFTFIGNTQQNDFVYSAKVDGSIPDSSNLDPVYDRSRFQIIDDVTGDSTVLYPTYSDDDTNSFTMKYINTADPNTPPTYDFSSLVNACYEINLSPVIGLYHDASGTLVEDYNIRKGDDPLLFKPLCKWIYGGDLIYENIVGNPNYPNSITTDLYKEIYYGSDDIGVNNNNCDEFVKIRTCNGFLNNACVDEQIEIISCPQ